jgi:PD-(D/E)XK endonuclease
MAPTKRKGDLAELKVACDLLEKGHRVAFPFGEDCDYDLVLDRGGKLERVQVKHAHSQGRVITVYCASASLTNGKVKRRKRYTAASIDWLAVYDRGTDRCFYIPAAELGDGRARLNLRLSETRNGQRCGIRYAEDYVSLTPRQRSLSDPAGQ